MTDASLAAPLAAPLRPRMTRVVARITGVNVIGAASGFITGPLLARALGPTGRGDLAAIVVPFTIAAPLLGLGIGGYAFRTLPRGRPLGDVVGSLGLPTLMLGALGAAVAVPAADALAGGRPIVRAFLIVGLLSMPIVMLASLLLSSLSALERWRPVMVTRIIPFGVTAAAVVVLYIAGALTVATAAGATIAGSLLSIVPGLPLLWAERPRFRRAIARAGLNFGIKSWAGGLAQMTNARLDQFLMITVVAPRVLGLYAVAVTISGATGLIGGALAPPLMARVGAGETHLISQAVRIMVAVSVCVNLALAAVSPVLLSVLFGHGFRGALPMLLILLVAQVPLVGVGVLSSALQADGAPMIPTIGEGIAVVVTVGGLIALLGPLGGVGAAIVSLAAYSSSFVFQLLVARRRTDTPLRAFLVPNRADLAWAARRLGALTGSLGLAH